LDMIVTSSLCIALSRLDGAGEQGAARAARHALGGIVRNPLPWAILFGGIASAIGLGLPGPLDRTVAMLADAAPPAALFPIGAVLARSAVLAREHRASAAVSAAMGGAALPQAPTPLRHVLPGVAIKLLVHPVLVWAVAQAAIALGLPLGRAAVVAIVLVAA